MTNLGRVGAIVRRDLITFTSYRVNMALDFISVWYFAVSFYFMGEFVGQPESIADLEGGFFEFVLVGAIVTAFAGLGLSAFSANIAEEQNVGTLEAVLTTPTPMWVVLTGGFVIPALFTVIEIVILVGVGLGVFGGSVPVASLLLATPVLALTTASFASLGILSAAFIVLVKRGDPFRGPIRQATMLLSGALFPVAVLPGWLELLTRLVPASYGVRATRELVQGGAGFADTLDEIAIMTVFTIVLLPLSIVFFRRAVTTARRAGTLVGY